MDAITDSQWLVIGLLILLFLSELVLHPTVSAGLSSFLRAFNPPKKATA
jgi:hypothetical protein